MRSGVERPVLIHKGVSSGGMEAQCVIYKKRRLDLHYVIRLLQKHYKKKVLGT